MKNTLNENFSTMFPDIRESGETVVKQSQLVMLRMLKILDYLCNKHQIDYFLVGGSLLGAIRHNGFIPWDDDLDIGMTRENYEKFQKKAVPELPYDIFFQTPETDPFFSRTDHVDAKLRDKYSSYTHLNGISTKWHEGLQIDIFIFDRAYLPNKLCVIIQNIVINLLSRKIDRRETIMKLVQRSNNHVLVYCNKWMKSLGMTKYGVNYFKVDEINELTTVKFEDMIAKIPSGWHTQLTRQYGNYMELPKPENRTSQHNVLINPISPCDHKETLLWSERNKAYITN